MGAMLSITLPVAAGGSGCPPEDLRCAPMATEVALFVTCLVDQLAPETGVAAVRLLEAAGAGWRSGGAVVLRQPALNTGEPEAAAVLAATSWRSSSLRGGGDAVGVVGAMVHHWYSRILDGEWAERAEAVAARTYELTSFLVDRLGATEAVARAAPLGRRSR